MEYFILKPNGEQTGTFSLEQIREMLKSGFIGLDTRYWHEGIPDWQPIERIEGSVHLSEPSPELPKTLPPPHQWSGSLARAIPSPHQKKKPAGPIVPGAISLSEPALPAAPPAPVIPAPQRPAIAVPAAELRPSTYARAEYEGVPRAISSVENYAAHERRSWFPRPSAASLSALALLLLTAAIIAAIVESRHPAKSPLSHVVVNLHDNCVLTDQTAIKPLEDDMRNAPVITRLHDLITHSTDPNFKQSASAGLQAEIEKHEREVTQKYLDAGQAEFVAPGIYSTVAYLDDTGAIIPARQGDPWAAFTYRGAVVYTYIGTDFRLRAPEPVTPASP